MGLVAPRHVGSSQARAWTCVPCTGRQILNHCATRDVHGGHSSSRCVGLLLSRPLLSQSTGSRRARSVVVAHGPSCSTACGIFPDQGSNLCPLHWQADSQPLRHQGSPSPSLLDSKQLEDFILLKCDYVCLTSSLQIYLFMHPLK